MTRMQDDAAPPSVAPRLLLGCGVVGPVLFVGTFLWAALIAYVMTMAHAGPAGLFERLATIVSALWTALLAARLVAGTGRVSPQG